MEKLKQKLCISNVIRKPEGYLVRVVSGVKPLEQAVTVSPNLEDVYLYYTSEFDEKRGGLVESGMEHFAG